MRFWMLCGSIFALLMVMGSVDAAVKPFFGGVLVAVLLLMLRETVIGGREQ